MSRVSTRPRSALVVPAWFGTIVVDGYDLVVGGITVPSISAPGPWRVRPARAGASTRSFPGTVHLIAAAALAGLVLVAAGPTRGAAGRRGVTGAPAVPGSVAH